MVSPGAVQCGCCTLCVGIIALIVFLASAMSTLEVNTYGLDYSAISKTINPDVKKSGIHFLGLGHSFIRYPSQMQTLDLGDGAKANRGMIEARSLDGLMVNFRATFQYQLNQKDLATLYLKFGEDYKGPCIRYAVDCLNDQASKFQASMFFRNLTTVGTQMQLELQQVFETKCYARIQSLQLSKADLPTRFEDALQATNVAIQDGITVKQTQQNVIIDMQTQINQAQIAAPVVVNNAKAKVNATLTTNKAQMESYLQVARTEAQAYGAMKSELSFGNDQTGDRAFLKFLKVNTISKFNSENLMLGVKK